ncbi:hypothetical protein CVT26_001063 [Gymnopilus dilepis]|uniref:Uncharacterized protein n=1 Tax=Gymnopilus dilepis TaxID=231916 RepID=A0A409WLD1_9AGAR|nr:hypothetical protein CVT26_001063 [Gymnopilus dilepis]
MLNPTVIYYSAGRIFNLFYVDCLTNNWSCLDKMAAERAHFLLRREQDYWDNLQLVIVPDCGPPPILGNDPIYTISVEEQEDNMPDLVPGSEGCSESEHAESKALVIFKGSCRSGFSYKNPEDRDDHEGSGVLIIGLRLTFPLVLAMIDAFIRQYIPM